MGEALMIIVVNNNAGTQCIRMNSVGRMMMMMRNKQGHFLNFMLHFNVLNKASGCLAK